MTSSLWILWIVCLFMFLLAPLGYGWGYRSWGPPYPRYIQRRRHAAAMSGNSTFDHQAWGIGGDIIWIVAMIVVFSSFGVFWRR
ncbi:MAG: hypothetical protein ABI627_15450 [Polyangiaceae bacterium]